MPGSGAPVRHVWGAASREIPPAHPNHNLDGFRVLLKTLRGFVFTLRPTCLWRARSASLQQLRGLCSAGGARSTSFGELLRSRLPLEAALPPPPSPPSERLEALAQPPSKKLLRLLPLEALAQPPSESSLNLLALWCRGGAHSTSFDASQPPQALAAAGGALAQPAASCGGARSTSFGELFSSFGELLGLRSHCQSNGRFIRAGPLRRISSLLTASRPRFRPRPPDCKFIKAAPLSRPAPTRRADPPRSCLWRPNPLLRRTSSLSTAGRSLQSRPASMASLSRPAPNGRCIKGFSQFIKASSNQKGRPLDLVLRGTIRYCAAQAVYQRPPGHGLQSRPAPMASLARPV